jgi:hypothetical protein
VVIVHFHGGPLSGKEMDIERPTSPILILRPDWVPSMDWRQHYHPGSYRRDPDSAGGRCYDWRER